ncbi:MAG: exo-alpha-sialidase [Acidobacteria bacterium]|nr:exo-alpha-sialidase [Acidobacteriota bacterium]
MKWVVLLLLAAGVAGAAPNGEFIFTEAPFPSCHASTVIELRNGDLLSAWFGGTKEGAEDVAIWSSRRSGGAWSAPVELVREPDIPTFNPVLFYTKDGRLWLYYKFGPHPVSWTAGRRWSDDEGVTWSEIEHLPAGIYGPIRAKPLMMEDGTIVSGTSVESYHSWSAWIERSTDGGETWTKSGPITVPDRFRSANRQQPESRAKEWSVTDGIIQPSVVLMGGNWLRLYARSTALTGRICVADSSDGGVTWTQARPLDLPNPNSGIDAVALKDGRVVMIYNHTDEGRTPLNLAVSRDGENFRMFHVIEDEPGEYSYPAMIQAANGDLLITYTWKRQRIRHLRFPLAEVPQQ